MSTRNNEFPQKKLCGQITGGNGFGKKKSRLKPFDDLSRANQCMKLK
jgi:hypothetical protein